MSDEFGDSLVYEAARARYQMDGMERIQINPSEVRLETWFLRMLRSDQQSFSKEFGEFVTKGNINVDFVHPPPLNKTLLEVACCENLVQAVKLLIELGANINRLNDNYDCAPIHFAAKAGHADVLQVLLRNKSCERNLKADKETALLIAVGNNYADCVSVLLDNCADPNIANSEGLTPIQIAASNGNRNIVQLILYRSKFRPTLDESTEQILRTKFPDFELPTAGSKCDITEFERPKFEGTELNFLEKLGQIPDYQITYAAGSSLMDFAVSYNYLNAFREVLRKGLRLDGFGSIYSSGKIAITEGRHEIFKEMLIVDETLGNIFLLEACSLLRKTHDRADGHRKCVISILEQPDINVHNTCGMGNTALHYAADANSIEVIRRLLELGSFLGHRNVFGETPLAFMTAGALSDCLDNCIWSSKDHIHHDACAKYLNIDNGYIEFDYRFLIPDIARTESSDEYDEEFELRVKGSPSYSAELPSEMDILAYIAENPDLQELLNHPLLSSFLSLKWHRIWQILCANFVFYVIFYALMNAYILSTDYKIDSLSSLPPNSSNLTSNLHTNVDHHTDFQQFSSLGVFTAIFLFLLSIRETFQLISSPGHYLSNFLENAIEIILIVLGFWMLVAPSPVAGAFVTLLSSWELVILIGQHPGMSTGIEMLKIVTLNFLQFLFLYAVLIIGFAFAFFALFCNTKDKENFHDVGHTLFKTIVMLTSEFDTNDIPFVSYPVLGRLIFVLFVFLMAIVLLNLLNGLAISDTSKILQKSEIVALISRVKLISYFEGVAVGSGLIKLAKLWGSEDVVRKSKFKPPPFVSMRTRLFPRHLREGKIYVMPYKSNKIIVDKMVTTDPDRRTCRELPPEFLQPPQTCDDCFPVREIVRAVVRLLRSWWTNSSMDQSIVHRAQEVLSRQKTLKSAANENENVNKKIIAEFHMLKAEIEGLKTAISKSGLGKVRRSSLSVTEG